MSKNFRFSHSRQPPAVSEVAGPDNETSCFTAPPRYPAWQVKDRANEVFAHYFGLGRLSTVSFQDVLEQNHFSLIMYLPLQKKNERLRQYSS